MEKRMSIFLFYFLFFDMFVFSIGSFSNSSLDDDLHSPLNRRKRSAGGSYTTDVTQTEYDSQGYNAVAYLDDGDGYVSTGTLISPTHIIASRMYLANKQDVVVYLILKYSDSGQEGSTKQTVVVNEQIYDPGYDTNANYGNNLAILPLVNPVPANFIPFRLPKKRDQVYDSCRFAGWGKNAEGSTPASMQKFTNYPYLVEENEIIECERLWKGRLGGNGFTLPASFTLDRKTQGCVGYLKGTVDSNGINPGPCEGDDGAPFFCDAVDGGKPILVGIISFFDCKPSDKIILPSIITKIDGELQFLADNRVPGVLI